MPSLPKPGPYLPCKQYQIETKSGPNLPAMRVLENDMNEFVKNELMRIKNILSPEGPDRLKEVNEETAGEEQTKSNREAFVKLALNFLRRRKHDELAEYLQNKTHAMISQQKLKTNLTRKFQCLLEGNSWEGSPKCVNQIYTELYITKHKRQEVNNQPEVQQTEAASWKPADLETIKFENIFIPERDEPVRTLVTKGVSGIGKTVYTQKYILDWAEDKANHNIHFIFPFTFRELNLLKDKTYSLVGLIHYFFTEIKEAGICHFDEFQVLFIFDGLDECLPPLDFHNTQILTNINEPTSVHVLITNLIRGKLLPSAVLWITTRPAAANQIPPEYVDMVTEVRGFTDAQKEDYFKKKFNDEKQASKIIRHIGTSRSLHIMCHIPIFCWITATVLDHVLKKMEKEELPKSLTEMYIHFLVVQAQLDNAKYHSRSETHTLWNADTKKIILALGKLAFKQLEMGNQMFYEDDLKQYDIDLTTASIYSGMLTEDLKRESGLNHERMFRFVHLSIQEFLAALYVFLKFMNSGVNLLRKKRKSTLQDPKYERLYQNAVDKALESPNGYLDMFVRFLLGLSQKDNQTHLRGLIKKRGKQSQVKKLLVQYIKKKISDCPTEKSIRMFYWLNELNDHSLEAEIQQYLKGNDFVKELTPSQWSALAFILLSSQKDLKIFDLKKFSASKEALVWLLPVIKESNKSLLSDCNLSWRSCISLVPALTSENTFLRDLDLSNNNLRDEGVTVLSQGLRNPNCRLEVLSLSGCQVKEDGCASLATALSFNPSHLRELDLSFNHPGESGLKVLYDGVQDPNWKLQTLKADHCGKRRLNPSPQRFFRELTLDVNTADRNLSLSELNKRVVVVKEKQPYPDHPQRFDIWKQILCSESFTGRCYWEVRWKGSVRIGVAYKRIKRKGDSEECCIGWNDHSWSLFCTSHSVSVWHNNTLSRRIPVSALDSDRIGVYLDWSAGTVSFYSFPGVVSSIKKDLLHTFQTTFTEPLYPAFGFGQTFEFDKDSTLLSSSVVLLDVE
ncbi:protein NLRC3-like [Nematolebias whitei]|uniref:protein NLRC3-like n=1 Tax=Nematolebias whitei TaxID=451745 RepID=UPI00189755E3|nr:protein NLRC3-like [Nematolebias whitei]